MTEDVRVPTHHAAPAKSSGFRGSRWQRWLSLVARLGLGGVLISAGGLKVTDPHQAALAVQAYQLLPTGVGEFVGYALPLFEILLGVALIVGVGTRLVAIISGILMIVFILGVSSAWARGLSIDCGCFGGGGAVPKGQAAYLPEILRDIAFLGLAVWLVAFPASVFALDRTGRAGIGDEGLYDEFDDLDDEDDDEDPVDQAVSAEPEVNEETGR